MKATGVREAIDRLLGAVDSIMEPETLSLRPEQSLEDAARELERAGISGGPVMTAGRVVGMVSLNDLFAAAGIDPGQAATSGPWHRYEHALAHSSKTVADAMSREVISMAPDASIADAASLMRLHRVNRIPVIDRAGSLRGIVARDDIVRAVAAVAHALHAVRAHPGASVLTPG